MEVKLNRMSNIISQQIIASFKESIELKKKMIEDNSTHVLLDMAEVIAKKIKAGGKLMLCGNGGSAADAQHLAAEMLVRLRLDYNGEGISP